MISARDTRAGYASKSTNVAAARREPIAAGCVEVDWSIREVPTVSRSASVILNVLPVAAKEVSMTGVSPKQKILEAIEKLPADATVDDAIERLVLLAKIERGLAELDAGEGIEHSEAKRRLLR